MEIRENKVGNLKPAPIVYENGRWRTYRISRFQYDVYSQRETLSYTAREVFRGTYIFKWVAALRCMRGGK